VTPIRSSAGQKLPTAVVLGLESNGLGVVRALGREKIPCIALSTPDRHPACDTRYCSVITARSWNLAGVVGGLKEIASRLEVKAPLLITRDQGVLWVSQAREELAPWYEIALPEPDTIDLLMNKRRFLLFAQSKGWPVPKTWFIENRDELLAHKSEYVYPAMLKPQLKNDAFRQHSPKKAFQVNSESELLQTYDLVAQWEEQVVVQEWIGGGDDRIAFCLGYRGRDGATRAAFAGRKLMQWPIQCGNTALSEPAPAKWREPLASLTEALWREVGYCGLGSLEFKMRPRNDQPVIVEPTVGRSDYQSELAVLNGLNIPVISYCDLAGIPYEPPSPPASSVKLVDGFAHWKSFRAYRRLGMITLAAWLRLRSGKRRYMIARRGDMAPFWTSIRIALRYKIGDILEGMFGRNAKERIKRALHVSAKDAH